MSFQVRFALATNIFYIPVFFILPFLITGIMDVFVWSSWCTFNAFLQKHFGFKFLSSIGFYLIITYSVSLTCKLYYYCAYVKTKRT